MEDVSVDGRRCINPIIFLSLSLNLLPSIDPHDPPEGRGSLQNNRRDSQKISCARRRISSGDFFTTIGFLCANRIRRSTSHSLSLASGTPKADFPPRLFRFLKSIRLSVADRISLVKVYV